MPYHWLDFTPPRPQIAAAPVANYSTAAHMRVRIGDGVPATGPPLGLGSVGTDIPRTDVCFARAGARNAFANFLAMTKLRKR